ncbi:uncharacterized protein BDZ99DRAFT_482536 [Mytilinidion resinicola]|uniref:Uncharacterized protein n=1 Tax=Mytilinidion resinicola TaxID=574789 RepID=A0A6A6Y2I9_9PEZI|nr:uncharacterized protein BDZ99DRAFT_482536 [Mytilinidion resinicola]KAF2803002.1 hypothetical protein BDZ99DRAFT_482536 [Mytilinidion resinicola]
MKGDPAFPEALATSPAGDMKKRLEPPPAPSQPEPVPEPEPAVNTFVFKFPTIESEREDPRSSREKSAAVPTEQRQAVQPEPEPEPESESESELESIPEPDPLTKSIFPGFFDSICFLPDINLILQHHVRTTSSSFRHPKRANGSETNVNMNNPPSLSTSTPRPTKASRIYGSKTRIWNPKWDQLPGMTWMHEEDPDDRPQTPDIIKEGREERRHRLSNGKQQLHSSRPGPPQLKPVLGVDNNRGGGNDIPSIPRDVNDSSGAVARPNDRATTRRRACRSSPPERAPVQSGETEQVKCFCPKPPSLEAQPPR